MRRIFAASTAAVLGAVLIALGFVAGVGAVPGGATYVFTCTSDAGTSSEVEYHVSASFPPHVQQGEPFNVKEVVVTGTPSVPLLIAALHLEFTVSPGANVASLSHDIAGPGASVPPGPIALPGIPNATDPVDFGLEAVGPVGTEISMSLAEVSSTVVNPLDLSQTAQVTCTYASGPPFGSTTIIPKHGRPTTTTPAIAPQLAAPSTAPVSTAPAASPGDLTTTPAAGGSTCADAAQSCDPDPATAVAGSLIGHRQEVRLPYDPAPNGAAIAFGLLLLALAATIAVVTRDSLVRS
jgi:hypothetical protein